MKIKYPNIKVRLTGEDGNSFAVLGKVNRALAAAGIGKTERDIFMKEATSGDYDDLLCTAMRWVDVS